MRSRRAAWPPSYALAALLLTIGDPPGAAADCPPGANLQDRDGDGLADYACAGDWDADGACETDDVQSAIDRLDDPGPKDVELGACSFQPPLVPHNPEGLVEVPDFVTLYGQGAASVLVGLPESDLVHRHAVLTNADHDRGNEHIVVRDFTIDGNWHAADSTPLGTHHRMGLRLVGCRHCRAERLHVHDTLHTCLYSRDGQDVEIVDNLGERCGNFLGVGNPYPCVYLFAGRGRTQSDVTVRGNVCNGSGAPALTTRREALNSVLRDVRFEDNVVTDTQIDENGLARPCIHVRGVLRAVYRNNRCVDAGGLRVQPASAYYSEGTDVESSADVTIDGLVLTRVHSAGALEIQSHVESFHGRGIVVEGATRSGIYLSPPQRNLIVEDSEFRDCGWFGLMEVGDAGFGAGAEDGLTLRRVSFAADPAGTFVGNGLYFRGAARNLTLEDLEVSGFRGFGMFFESGLGDSAIQRSHIVDARFDGIRVTGGWDRLVLAGNLIERPRGAGLRLDGPADASFGREGLAIHDNRVHDAGQTGLLIAAPGPVAGLSVEHNVVERAGSTGLDVTLDGGIASSGVRVAHNVVRGFGLFGAEPRVGIRIAGAASGTVAPENVIDSPAAPAAPGLAFDAGPSANAGLCSTQCAGQIAPTECVWAADDPGFGSDLDADLRPDPCDNCPAAFNPVQGDRDEDTQGDRCDPDDGGLFLAFDGPAQATWDDERAGTGFDAYLGSLSVLRSTGTYTQEPGAHPLAERVCGTPHAWLEVPTTPAPGEIQFVLVGWSDGTGLGTDSAGMERPNHHPCP